MEQSAPQPQAQPKPMLQKPPGYRDPDSKSSALRKAALPPSFRPKPKRRSCCRICCCTCCIVILVLILALVIAAGLFYLIYNPSLPEFHLSSFRILKFNVSDGSDGAYLDADTAMRVEVKNRSGKMTWRFARSRVSISAEKGELDLGSTNLAGFSVKEKGVAELKAETRVRDRALNERQRRRLKSVVESKALVPTLELRTKTGVALQGWNSPYLSVTVVCGDVTMRQLQNGDPPLCSITLFNWVGHLELMWLLDLEYDLMHDQVLKYDESRMSDVFYT
ncbi:NDR1/HIN1-like protein 13, partial [Mucuna pruriens]